MPASSTHSTGEANIKKLSELIRDMKFAMFTTVDPDGCLRSRPMATQDAEFDGDIWFVTSNRSGKMMSIKTDQHVNVAYTNPEKNIYISVNGRAEIVTDRRKLDELWTPFMKAWFPKGKDDPEITLIRVRAESAEYWDSPSSPIVHLFGFAKAMLTGHRADDIGENARVDIANPPVH